MASDAIGRTSYGSIHPQNGSQRNIDFWWKHIGPLKSPRQSRRWDFVLWTCNTMYEYANDPLWTRKPLRNARNRSFWVRVGRYRELTSYLTPSIQSSMIPAHFQPWLVVQRRSSQELDASSFLGEGIWVFEYWKYPLVSWIHLNSDLSLSINESRFAKRWLFSFNYTWHGLRCYWAHILRFNSPSERVTKEHRFLMKAYRPA
jgi:hypothetical protein